MLTDDITDFYRQVGLPLEMMVARRPPGASEESVLKAAEEVFDSGCYQLIQMPREIWRRAVTYQPKDYAREQREKLGVAYWSKRYYEVRNNHRALWIVSILGWAGVLGVWIWKAM